jgi:antitoxin VapB
MDGDMTYVESDGSVLKKTEFVDAMMSGDGVELSRRPRRGLRRLLRIAWSRNLVISHPCPTLIEDFLVVSNQLAPPNWGPFSFKNDERISFMDCFYIPKRISFWRKVGIPMALYIKDDSVDDLAIKYQQATGAASKTAAVRKALLEGLAALKRSKPLMERMTALQEIADDIGDVDPAFNQKTFADDVWSEK